MKTNRVLVLVAMVMISEMGFSQDKLDKLFSATTADERARFQTERMKEQLPLREDQQDDVYAINLKYTGLMETVYNQGGGKIQRLKRMRSVNQQKDAELKNVLDTHQYNKYEEMKDEMREAMKERYRENRR